MRPVRKALISKKMRMQDIPVAVKVSILMIKKLLAAYHFYVASGKLTIDTLTATGISC
jgi:hypothetical protein